MLSSSQRRLLRWLCRIYGLMLLTYPPAFRHQYGHEMTLVFNNRAQDIVQREGGWALWPFMLHIGWDWLQTVAREQKDVETNSALIARINGVAVMSVLGVDKLAGTPYPDPDRQSRAVWLMLTAVGASLLVVGWCRWLSLKGFL
jgi:hypothetical protein